MLRELARDRKSLYFRYRYFLGIGSERLTNFRWKPAVDVDTICMPITIV
jgi:hypothetical protein